MQTQGARDNKDLDFFLLPEIREHHPNKRKLQKCMPLPDWAAIAGQEAPRRSASRVCSLVSNSPRLSPDRKPVHPDVPSASKHVAPDQILSKRTRRPILHQPK